MGGEEEISPEKGILYPSLVVLAARLGALIIEPEHRFFGASQPLAPAPFSTAHLRLLTPQQALADAAALIEAAREARKCTGRNGQPRCPAITAGGSYPGWQAFAMRLRYPAVVDMAYSASPALGFYNQAVDPFA
jgi:dipeptidyl-peptidase-2